MCHPGHRSGPLVHLAIYQNVARRARLSNSREKQLLRFETESIHNDKLERVAAGTARTFVFLSLAHLPIQICHRLVRIICGRCLARARDWAARGWADEAAAKLISLGRPARNGEPHAPAIHSVELSRHLRAAAAAQSEAELTHLGVPSGRQCANSIPSCSLAAATATLRSSMAALAHARSPLP